jgi:hypothetical protein
MSPRLRSEIATTDTEEGTDRLRAAKLVVPS